MVITRIAPQAALTWLRRLVEASVAIALVAGLIFLAGYRLLMGKQAAA